MSSRSHIKATTSKQAPPSAILARYPFRNYLFIIVTEKHGSFSATIRQNGLSIAKTAIVPEKSCNSSATMKPKPPRRGARRTAIFRHQPIRTFVRHQKHPHFASVFPVCSDQSWYQAQLSLTPQTLRHTKTQYEACRAYSRALRFAP